MISEIVSPTATMAQLSAEEKGYRFEPIERERVQLITPAGQPAGNFADRSAAARSVSLIEGAIKR